MYRPETRVAIALAGILLCSCVPMQREVRSSALDFLYPKGAEPTTASDVELTLPVRVGLAFAPASSSSGSFTENEKQRLLERVAAAFRDHPNLGSVEAIPSTYFKPGGGFPALDQIAAAFGIDLIVLVSYDQFQFSETARSSWTYWTLVGAYLVKGEKNETRTFLNAVVYDIPSRAMLFQASGENSVRGKATPVELQKELRLASEESFALATDDLIEKLRTALAAFEQQAASGSVRGVGTPAISVRASAAEGGAGALGLLELAAMALLLGTALGAAVRRARHSARTG